MRDTRSQEFRKEPPVPGVRSVDIMRETEREAVLRLQQNQGVIKCSRQTSRPLVSRLAVSRFASQTSGHPGERSLMTLGVSRALQYQNMEREVVVELPDGNDRESQSIFMIRLTEGMRGLRDASQISQKVVKQIVETNCWTPRRCPNRAN